MTAQSYLRRVLNARVYDVAIESALDPAPGLSERLGNTVLLKREDEQSVFSVRTFYDRPHKIDEKPQLLESIDDWNRRTLWPKVYTHTHDDGTEHSHGHVHQSGLEEPHNHAHS